jgi:hypothetical protein
LDTPDAVPVYRCLRIETNFDIDGDLFMSPWTETEPVWFLPATLEAGSFVEEMRAGAGGSEGFRRDMPAQARILAVDHQPTAFAGCWSATHLYLAWQCFDRDIWSTCTQRDDPLYEQEVVEAFLCPTGDLRRYYEINISPANVIFDARVHSPDLHRGTMEADVSWDCPGLRTAVRVQGTLNDRTDLDAGWSVEAAIPFSAFPETGPPKPGDEWRANFFRIDRADPPEFTCWSPTREVPANFHVPERFGVLRFV